MSKLKNVIASFNPKAGRAAQVEAVLRDMVAPTRAEPGCLRYDLYRAATEPQVFHLFESYRDEDSLFAHRETAHYKAYRAAITHLLEQAIEVLVLDPVDVRE